MAKRSSSKSSKSSSSNSSPDTSFATGIFGHLVTGSTVSCKSTDNTFFCNLTKVFNSIIMIIAIIAILYFIISLGYNFLHKK